jgi:ankyrin repeat protein
MNKYIVTALMVFCASSFFLKAAEQTSKQGHELERKDQEPPAHTPSAPIKVYEANAGFPVTLDHLAFEKHLAGGSGGVLVLKDPTGKRYTLKGSNETDHIKEEIMADGLYHALGVPVPSFAIYTQLPSHLIPAEFKENFAQGPYRLAEFIEGQAAEEEVKGQENAVKDFFVADAFLANRDGKAQNIIKKHDGTLVRIDNGGALRYRSVGGRKGEGNDRWDLNRIPELATFRSSQSGAQSSYHGLSFEDVKRQANNILKRSDHLLDAFKNLSQALDIRHPHELEQMLTARLNFLVSVVRPGSFGLAKADSPVSDYTGAGILVYATDPKDGQIKVLLGKRARHNYWGQLGGKSDAKPTPANPIPDRSLAETAVRETREESMGLFSFTLKQIEPMPSHDLIRIDAPPDPEMPGEPDIERYAAVFRMYFAPHGFIPAQTFTQKLQEIVGAEYEAFTWVPVSAFLNMAEANYITINNQPISLHPPFADMLRQGSVKSILEIINHEKTPPKKHTEGLAGVKDSFEPTTVKMKNATTRQYIYLKDGQKGDYEEKVFPEPQQEERALAENVIKMGSVVGDIKRLPQDKSGIGIKEAVTHIRNPKPLPLALPAQMPYTQTEGHMKIVLGNQFEPITGHDEATMQEQIRANILKILNTKVRDGKQMAADNSYVDQLTDAALRERLHPNKYVFYHGTDATTGFLYDVITKVRMQLMASTHPDTVMLRGIDQAFVELMRETGQEGIGGLIQKFTEEGQKEIYNYQGNYQDLAISANACLFGSLGTLGSETFQYFFSAHSKTPPDMQKFFKYFAIQLGLPLEFEKYEPLLKESMACDKTENGRLYQIFIGPEVDQMAYAALPGGREFKTPESAAADAPVSSKIKHLLDSMRTDPDHFLPQEEAKDGEAHRKDYAKLQARLLMKPEWMMDPRIVQVNRYWRCPALQASYHEKLRDLVREDLKRYLLSHRVPKEGALIPSGAALLHQYKAAFERATGKPYVPASQDPVEELKELIEAGDTHGLQKWSEQYPDVHLLTKPFPRMDYRSRVGDQDSPTPLELAVKEGKFEAALYIWKKISLLVDAKTAEKILWELRVPDTRENLEVYLRKSGSFINALFEKILENNNSKAPTFIYKVIGRLPFNREFVLFLINHLTPEQLNILPIEQWVEKRTLLDSILQFAPSHLKYEDKLAVVDALIRKGAKISALSVFSSIYDKPLNREFMLLLINHLRPEELKKNLKNNNFANLLESIIETDGLAKEDKIVLLKALMDKGAEVRSPFLRAFIGKAIDSRTLDREFLISFLNHSKLVNNQVLLACIIENMHKVDKEDKWVLVKALIGKGTKVEPRYVNRAIKTANFDKDFVVFLINHLTPEQLNTKFVDSNQTLLEKVMEEHYLKNEDKLALIQALLGKGATVKQEMIHRYQPYLQDSQIIETLESSLANEEAKATHLPDKDGDTPLHLAARDGDVEAIKKLLADRKAKATLLSPENIQNKDGQTPFHLAAEKGHAEVIEALLADAQAKAILLDPQNIQDRAAGLNLLSLAVGLEKAEAVKALLADEQARGVLLQPENISADDRSILNEFLAKNGTEIANLLKEAGYSELTPAPQVSEHAAAGHHQH